jgi:4-aminobutyrate--pyruvate transaminase
MSLAKSISSAYLPLSAVVIPEFMYEPIVEASGDIGTFGHGFTYSGHPVCAAVALRTLELMEARNLFAHAAAMGALFQQRLRGLGGHDLVGEARGVGLIGAVELVADKEKRTPYPPERGVGALCATHAEATGLIVRPLGDSIAICPPLIISEQQIDELFTKLETALNETLRSLTARERSRV